LHIGVTRYTDLNDRLFAEGAPSLDHHDAAAAMGCETVLKSLRLEDRDQP
jgi:hypothetical protein